MCAHIKPPRAERIAERFNLDPREYTFKEHVFPTDMAPIIRPLKGDLSTGQNEVVSAMFGMVPHWAETKLARSTYNSRSETTATKPSFRNAWKRRQFCIVPVEEFYEPSYETGKAVKWGIRHVHGELLGIAAIWEVKPPENNGAPLVSFSMLTINADDHPLMKRFHKPEDEKRSIVILRPEQYDAWINATLEEAPTFLQPYPAKELHAEPVAR
jgi:putative SOS response-associated peptidase YedK